MAKIIQIQNTSNRIISTSSKSIKFLCILFKNFINEMVLIKGIIIITFKY